MDRKFFLIEFIQSNLVSDIILPTDYNKISLVHLENYIEINKNRK